MAWFAELSQQLPVFGLLLLRCTGLLFMAPIFGQQRVPLTVRILLSLSLSAMLLPVIPMQQAVVPTQTLGWVLTGLLEVLTGAIYGWAATAIFEGIVLAGQFIGLQMGFAQANILNPDSQTQRPLLSEVYFVLAVLVFLSLNGHHLLIRVLQQSFTVVPLGQFLFGPQTLAQLSLLFAQIFGVALMIAAPINGILTLIDIIMGLIARTAPQMNILLLSFSIKIYVGLLTLLFSLGFTVQFLRDLLPRLMDQVMRLFTVS